MAAKQYQRPGKQDNRQNIPARAGRSSAPIVPNNAEGQSGLHDRSNLMEWIRGELVGPQLTCQFPVNPTQQGQKIPKILSSLSCLGGTSDKPVINTGSNTVLFHKYPDVSGNPEEIIWYKFETPRKRYGVGVLYPARVEEVPEIDADQDASDDPADDQLANGANNPVDDFPDGYGVDDSDDFEIAAKDRYKPSSLGISFHVKLTEGSCLKLSLPDRFHFSWQLNGREYPVNGFYKAIGPFWFAHQPNGLNAKQATGYARFPAALPAGLPSKSEITIPQGELRNNVALEPKVVSLSEGCPLKIRFRVFPRETADKTWLITVVLENVTEAKEGYDPNLYQTHFTVTPSGDGASFLPYPESNINHGELTPEEKDLALLYRHQEVWGTGHGCSAGWPQEGSGPPHMIWADVMPGVETPSMTPDLAQLGGSIPLRDLSFYGKNSITNLTLSDTWQRIESIPVLFESWINQRREEANRFAETGNERHTEPALRNADACVSILQRIKDGINLIKTDEAIRSAFMLANHAMLLQNLATKRLKNRPLQVNDLQTNPRVCPAGQHSNPNEALGNLPDDEQPAWRAFQIAFLLMSIKGVASKEPGDPERNAVDLIWFPTGGGKTEAYLAVASFAMFYERLRDSAPEDNDASDILMRYTLRMLTTQQFQRASALICAMEWMRNDPSIQNKIPNLLNNRRLGERRFSLGLWIGNEASPGNNKNAHAKIQSYRNEDNENEGNPLVLNECPWCRSSIGKLLLASRPHGINAQNWRNIRLAGIMDSDPSRIKLHCPDTECFFNADHLEDEDDDRSQGLPIEVIDENIYAEPPSFLIGTADKFAMLAYRPEARSIFGLPGKHRPPVLILQDELHLISGPLGTMYAMYETVIENLCTHADRKPKIICSTATIRGAQEQVKALYDRDETVLFPRPVTTIGDSFFGTFARDSEKRLLPGRLYLGINAINYPSFQTVQVRVFSRVLQAVLAAPIGIHDAWWTLLIFYNSIRELAGASTLYRGDIAARLRALSERDGTSLRWLRDIREISARYNQSELSMVLDRLSYQFPEENNRRPIDVAAASNIIEVGVDIDRLAIMGVLGQPKTTAQYIQVTGRVGRKPMERPGLVLMLYSSSKSRDISHYEQFHTYHRRLYERVEPTSATPFTCSAVARALGGLVLAYLRQRKNPAFQFQEADFNEAIQEVRRRAVSLIGIKTQEGDQIRRDLSEDDRVVFERETGKLRSLWEEFHHDTWHKWSLSDKDSPVFRSFDQYADNRQKFSSFPVPMSLRQVDASGDVVISRINLKKLLKPS